MTTLVSFFPFLGEDAAGPSIQQQVIGVTSKKGPLDVKQNVNSSTFMNLKKT